MGLRVYILSAENQKGVITIQGCFVESQKGASAIDFIER